MAILDVNRLYSDGEVLTEDHLDRIRADIEEFFNVTKIDGENIQNAGITGSSALTDASISAAKIQDLAVTSAKIVTNAIVTSKVADGSVTSPKIADNAITESKLNSLFLPAEQGAIKLFHTYNSLLSVPRGFMICNGDVVNQTNYEDIHGAGTYSADQVSGSLLLSKHLPNFVGVFAVGASTTTQDGSTAITTTGNTNSEVDIAHSHSSTGTDHTHSPGTSVFAQKFARVVTQTVPYRNTPSSIKLTDDSTFSLATTGTLSKNIAPEGTEFLYLIRVI